MSFKCKLGFHSWDGCKCSDCGITRDEQHNWNNCKCSTCGKEQHDFSKDCEKCSKCGTIEKDKHDWSKDCEKCSKCGKTRIEQHDWSKDCEKCSKCGNIRHGAHKLEGYKCSICNRISKPKIEWKFIPAGTFTMGSPVSEIDREQSEYEHQVTLSAFHISKYEVTFEEYDLFCEATGREKPDDSGWGRENRPVINVDWDDATAFAEWMGCRLPTEAEWEYACRAGSSTAFNTGKNLTASEANYNGDSPYSNYEKGEFREKTMPVGSFKANAWQLYDMHGNVREWCSDWESSSAYYDDQTDPKGPATGEFRIFRGGSWGDSAEDCRSAARWRSCYYQGKSNEIGFRLAKG